MEFIKYRYSITLSQYHGELWSFVTMNPAKAAQDSVHPSMNSAQRGHKFDQREKSKDDEHAVKDKSQSKVQCTIASFARLYVFSIVFIVQVPALAGVICSNPNDIRLRNPKTASIEGCIVCPECVPSQQYSIRCGSTIDIGNVGHCEDCPEGTFSDKFDKKPCQSCTICTNKVYKQNCTKYQNAKCGDCLPGYRYDPITFACSQIAIKVTDMVKLTNKVKLTTTVEPTTKANESTTKSAGTLITASSTESSVSKEPPPRPKFIITNSTTQFVNQTTRNDLQPMKGLPKWAIALILSSGIIFVTLSVGIGFYLFFIKKRTKSSRGSDEEAIAELLGITSKTHDEQLLKDFIDNNFDQTESLCKVLFKKRHGTWDFERVGKKWFRHIGDTDLAYIIEFGSNIENSTPVRTILQKLCTEVHPPLTVRMFADSLKKINKKAYRILQPYFKKPTLPVHTTAR